MHWCNDETMLLLACLPGLSYVLVKVRAWVRSFKAWRRELAIKKLLNSHARSLMWINENTAIPVFHQGHKCGGCCTKKSARIN